MKKYFVVTLALLLFTTGAQTDDRIKIGLALSGGGARGGAHIGVLRELERLRIPVDYIAGTSIGAIIGGMYAAGHSTDDIERVLVETDWDDIFKDKPPRKYSSIREKSNEKVFQLGTVLGVKEGKLRLPSGLIQGQKLQLLLEKLFLPVADIEHFHELPVPFSAVATDMRDGSAVVLESGDLATAVRASMSVPVVFAEVKIGDQILVDGGMANNLPIDVVRKMGADVVIAVDIGTPFLDAEELNGAIGISKQISNILVRRTTLEQISTLSDSDHLITPELGEFSSANFKGASEIIENGLNATRKIAQSLDNLRLSESEYQSYLSRRGGSSFEAPLISFIRVNNQSALSDNYILSRIRQDIDQTLDFQQLEEDIGIIYGLDVFRSVDYSLIERGGETGLIINARPKTWGPAYLRFGLSYTSDMSNENQLEINLGYTVKPLNDWNAEFQGIVRLGEEPGLFAEYNQPLDSNSPYFFNSSISYTNNRFNTFEEGTKINEVRAKKSEISISLGKEIGYSSDVRLGLNRSYSVNKVEIGSADESIEDFSGGEVFALYRFDTLDNLFFPKKGVYGSFEWISSFSELGADNEFDQALFDLQTASTFGKHTFNLGAKYFSTVSGSAPVQNFFRFGGLFNFPGFSDDELSGQDLYLLRSAYRRPFISLMNTTPEIGITLQYGQITNNKNDLDLSEGIAAAGIWLGWDTRFGPAYIGAGTSESKDSSIYLILGTPF